MGEPSKLCGLRVLETHKISNKKISANLFEKAKNALATIFDSGPRLAPVYA